MNNITLFSALQINIPYEYELVNKYPDIWVLGGNLNHFYLEPGTITWGFGDGNIYVIREISLSEEEAKLYKNYVAPKGYRYFLVARITSDLDRAKAQIRPLIPAWMDETLTVEDLRHKKVSGPTGRFFVKSSYDYVASVASSMLWHCRVWDVPLDTIQYVPDVQLILNNKKFGRHENRFQVWSDEVFTFCGCENDPLYILPKELERLVAAALRQKEWRANSRWRDLLSKTITNLEKVYQNEQDYFSLSSRESLSGEAFKITFNTGEDIWLVHTQWGYMGEDGDAGEEDTICESYDAAVKEIEDYVRRK
jgi:hypothetical protein